MSDSIFIKILNKEIPSEIIYEDDAVFAIRDINPIAPVHILIIPKEPISTLNDLDEANADIIAKMVLVAKQIAAEQGIADDGYRLIMNCGKNGGQSIFHIHCHLLGGKQLNWNA